MSAGVVSDQIGRQHVEVGGHRCKGPISTPLAEAARSARTDAERLDAQRGGEAHMVPVDG